MKTDSGNSPSSSEAADEDDSQGKKCRVLLCRRCKGALAGLCRFWRGSEERKRERGSRIAASQLEYAAQHSYETHDVWPAGPFAPCGLDMMMDMCCMDLSSLRRCADQLSQTSSA